MGESDNGQPQSPVDVVDEPAASSGRHSSVETSSVETSSVETSDQPAQPVVGPAETGHHSPEEKAASRAQRVKRRRRRKIVGWVLIAAGVVILAVLGWLGWRGYQAYAHLQAASTDVSTLQNQLRDFTSVDPAATSATVERLQIEAAAARSAVDDPIYRAATVIPFIGPSLGAMREVALTVDSLATNVMPSLQDVASTLQPAQLAPKDGTFDLAPIERISPLLQRADDAVIAAQASMADVDRSAVVQPVGDAVGTLAGKLEQAGEITGPAARIARMLPPVLGSTGPRTYLVAFQNPAELRATGGIFGSYAVITADNGKITIVEQGASSRTLGLFSPPAGTLTQDEINLYSPRMVRFPADVNFTPDFPTAAQIFAEMYQRHGGAAVDGVLAIDPVALSYMLKGTPPIDVGDGVSITAENLVPTLLSTAYQKYDDQPDQADRDAFLAHATGVVFTDLMSGSGNPKSIVAGLQQAAGERRVLTYLTDSALQADIASTEVSGAMTADQAAPSIGVFLNDGTAAKLGYYLTNEVHVTSGDCSADGRRELDVQVVMHYNAPESGLPTHVTGDIADGAPYILQTNVLVFAPSGGGIVDATQKDGARVGLARGEDQSRDVGELTVQLAPGESTSLRFTVLAPLGAAAAATDVVPHLILTPGVAPWVTSVDPYRVCQPATD